VRTGRSLLVAELPPGTLAASMWGLRPFLLFRGGDDGQEEP
jgi:hypothetical protein